MHSVVAPAVVLRREYGGKRALRLAVLISSQYFNLKRPKLMPVKGNAVLSKSDKGATVLNNSTTGSGALLVMVNEGALWVSHPRSM